MAERPPLTTVRERNRRKRLAGWVTLYAFLLAVFVFAVYWQASRVNTLGFAGGTLQLTTSKTKYTVGDTISYTLKNGLNQPILLTDTCPHEPLYSYMWVNNSWARIHDTAIASDCTGKPKQRTISVGGSYTQTFANWPSLFNKPGIYRIVALASNYTAIPYADFQVVARPVAPQVQVQTRTQIVIQQVITPKYIYVPSSGGDGGGGDN